MNDNRIVLDSSQALKAMDDINEKIAKMIPLHEELENAFLTAYKNDNLFFYSKMAKLSAKIKESFIQVKGNFTNLSDQLVEHSNRMAKFSEEY